MPRDRSTAWLDAHDPAIENLVRVGTATVAMILNDSTKLFAGIASRARQVFGISARQVHVDTSSFSVSGAYSRTGERVEEPSKSADAMEAETALIAITYGCSRDHREERTAVDVCGFPTPMMGMSRCS